MAGMIEIQYAVFCQEIDFSQTPPVFKHPISLCKLPEIEPDMKLVWPMFATFIGGCGLHCLTIHIESPSGQSSTLPDFSFEWPEGKPVHGELFTVKFHPDTFGTYTFKLTVDGQSLRTFNIPIEKA